MFDLKEELSKQNINITDNMIEKFNQYFDLLISYNERVNITRITERDEVFSLHFYDSIMASLKIDNKESKVLDIGSGAGLPAIPLKIVYDTLDITMVDSVNKKVIFLENVIDKLNLKGIRALHERIEKLNNKNYYDYVTVRALSSVKDIINYSYQYLKKGGKIIALKGMKKVNAEIEEAKDIIKNKGFIVDDIMPYNVLDRSYCLLVLKKE